jgi:SpoVK/Ycf46/Vps4 family AAA+-type ATPase
MSSGFFGTGYTNSNDYKSPNKLVTREYYDMLLEFSNHLSDIIYKLKLDESIYSQFKSLNEESNRESFIPYCILYDLSQIFKILTDDKLDNNSPEIFGLVLLSTRILNKDSDSNMLNYNNLTDSFYKGGFNSMAALVRGYCKEKNPISINMTEREDNKILSSKAYNSTLSLPQILKISDHPLFNEYVTTLYRFASIIAKADNTITKNEEFKLKTIYEMTYDPLPEEIKTALPKVKMPGRETLQDTVNELDNLIGLEGVKNEVKKLINFIHIQKEREKQGLKSSQISYHCVFTGSPGTGKTTIARLISQIYKNLGVLEKGHLVETDRSGLVAEYTGQTAPKVDRVVKAALDGVLFIDEAYSLASDGKDDFGKEAIAALIKRMEDNRDKLVLIVAGYQNEMKTFISSNPGFKSRFNRFIHFQDYSPDELLMIYESLCSKSEYKLTPDARETLTRIFKHLFDIKKMDFGNARLVRNLFEKTIENQSNRIASLEKLTRELLTTIEVDDIIKIDLAEY